MASTPQDLYNASPSGIDPVIAMTSNGVSENMALTENILNNPISYDFGEESLSQSLKRVSELKVVDFNSIYKPTLNLGNIGIDGSGASGSRGKIDPFSSPDDNTFSWIGDRINVDEYYNQMSEDWANLDKDNAGLIGTGGGIVAGAATGAAIGSLGGPIGAAIGGVVGGILGGIEGNQVSKNIGYGYVRNKFGFDEQAKYNQQGFWGRAGAGLMNMVHSADSLTLGTLGTIAYLPQSISERSLNVLFNNDFTKLLDDYDKSSQSSNRIYHSTDYDNSSLIGKLAHSEMWFEQVAPAVGFMIGAIGVGRATGLGLGAVGLGGAGTGAAGRAFLAETIGAAAKGETQALGRQALLNGFKQAARQELRNQTFKSMAGNMVTLLTSASPESGLEARGAMNEAQENYIKAYNNAYGRLPSSEEIANFDVANKESGNGVFAANLAVVGLSNWLQFGDAMGLNKVVKKGLLDDSINKVFGLGIKKTVGDVSEKGIQSAVWEAVQRTKLQKLGYRALKALQAPATEGLWEEGIQHVISDTHKNYLESRFNPQATEINKSLLNAFGESFVNTYTSEAGWNDIMIGMIVGAGGTVRARGGFDILNQRQVGREERAIAGNVQNLNETQNELISAHEDYLSKQAIYNNLANVSTARLSDKIGALNQQVINSDLSKKYIASGNLEQAQLAYQNSLFAKLSAEKRAGLSESNKFDLDMMVENIPEDALTNLYNFRTPEQIAQFKQETQTNLNNLVESFDAAYEMAESLNIGTNSGNFSPAQVTEMAALNFFHGMHSADNANNIAQALEQTTGINGIADAMNYYSNLTGVQQRRMGELEDLQKQLTELESKHNDLLNSFSTEINKPQREGENEVVVTQLDRTNNAIAGVQSEIESVNNRINTLTNILNSKESIPEFPFSNPAIKYFDAVNLTLADNEASNVLGNMQSLDRYVEHLLDTTEKTEDEISIDRNKADMLQSLVGAYKAQMALMRNFAKAAQMIADPAYVNNLSKGIFNSKKYDAIFDNTDWIENNESGFDELSKEEFRQLKEKLDSGIISKYDVHTFLTNAEILRMGASTQEGNTIQEQEDDIVSKEDLQDIVNQDDEGNMNLDTSSVTYKNISEAIAQDLAYGNELSSNQQLVYNAIQSNETEFESLNERINEIKSEAEVSPVTIGETNRNSRLAQEQRLNKIAEDRRNEINARYDELIANIPEESPIEEVIVEEAAQESELSEAEASLPESNALAGFNGHDQINFRNSNFQQVGFDIDGNHYNVITGFDRAKTLISINGITIPFYLTSGHGGKGLTPGWYPFFGIGKDGWMNKTDKADMETYYERYWGTEVADIIREISEELNQFYGTEPSSFSNDADPTTTVRPITTLADKVEDYINDAISITPTANNTDARKSLRSNVEQLGNDILDNYDENAPVNEVEESTNRGPQPFSSPELEVTTPTDPVSAIDPIGQLEAERQNELDEVERILEEALNPVEQRTIQINTELDRLNAFIENVIDELKSASKELNVETVDNFDLNPQKVSKIFDEYETLFNKEEKTNDDEARLTELKSLINKYGLVEGRVIDYQGAPIRLSDVLEQRVFLENEHFNTESELMPLSDVETTLVTTEAPTDEFTAKTRGGDPTVLNNYDFATFTGSNSSNEVSVANITPELLMTQLLNGKQDWSIEVDNNEISLDQANDFIAEGQVVRITFPDVNNEMNRVSFQLDKSRRIILPSGDIQTLEENSPFRFNSDNIIGSSGYYTLTMDVNGVQVPVKSDFNLAQLIDSQAAQRLNPGDNIFFEVELDSTFNQGLLNRMSPFLSSVSEEDRAKFEPLLNLATEAVDNTTRLNVLKANIASSQKFLDELNEQIDAANDATVTDRATYNKEVVFPLVDRATSEDKKIQALENEVSSLQARNKEIRVQLNVDFNKIPYDRILRNLEKKLGKSKLSDSQQKEFDALRKEFKDSMVIVSKDKSGNTVGIVKAFNNSNGQNALYMDYLRNSLFSKFESSGYKNAKSSFTVPVQIVYMGIPNISSTEAGKVLYEFSRDTGDNMINPNKVMDIGYVGFNELRFNSGAKYSTPYNYAQSIMRDKAYTGRQIPVIMFRYNGKEVIYPVSLKEALSSDVVVSQYDSLVSNKSKDFSAYINDINEFLSSNKISPKYRLTSLNYTDEYVGQIRDVIENSEFYPSVEEFLNTRNIAQTLIDNALIDIDLNNSPFIGPKIKLALNQVPEFNSELSNTDKVINDNSPIQNQAEENKDENECNFELD
jgi:hypothetical protein